MTIVGAIFLIIILIRLLKCYDYEKNLFFFFMMTVIVNLFINVGYWFNAVSSLSYGECMMIFCVIYGFYGKKIFSIKQLVAAVILIACVVIGNVNIYLNSSDALIVSWKQENIDYITYGFESAVNPIFGVSNIKAMIWLFAFIVFCFNNAQFFHDKYYVTKMRNILIKTFHIMCWIIIAEFVISNLTSGTIARKTINYMFGYINADKTYMIAPKRYGFYCAYGFLAEPSYMAIFLVYGTLLISKKKIEIKELKYCILSVICLLTSGSTAAYMVIPYIIGIALYKNIISKSSRAGKIEFGIICCIVILCILYYGLFSFDFSSAGDGILDKIINYITGGNSNINSGYTRSHGNARCYSVLRYNPLFGVGLGTTRGYGLLPGMVACLGIVGSLSLGYFYIEMFNVEVKKNKVVLLILIAYCTSFFSVWYIYSAVMIGLFLGLNKNLYIDESNDKLSIEK